MNVKELIKILKTKDPKAIVLMDDTLDARVAHNVRDAFGFVNGSDKVFYRGAGLQEGKMGPAVYLDA